MGTKSEIETYRITLETNTLFSVLASIAYTAERLGFIKFRDWIIGDMEDNPSRYFKKNQKR